MDKYLVVPKILQKDACEVLGRALLVQEQSADDSKFGDGWVKDAYWRSSYSATDALLQYLHPQLEKLTGLKLKPNWSFCRVYRNGHELRPHIDKEHCEISVSLNLMNDGVPWPLYMGDDPVYMEQGDCVIYKGCELKHYRYPFEGEEHVQCFLHYNIDK